MLSIDVNQAYRLLLVFVILIVFILIFLIWRASKIKPFEYEKSLFTLKTIYLKIDLNLKEVRISYHRSRVKVQVIPLADFEKFLSSDKLMFFYQFLDQCMNQETVKDELVLHLGIDHNDTKPRLYHMKFLRKDKKSALYFSLILDKDNVIDKKRVENIVDFPTFKAMVKSMSDDAYTSVGILICIYLKLHQKIKERYSSEVSYYYRYELLSRVRTLANEKTIASVDGEYLWIYQHELVKKGKILQFLNKLKKHLGDKVVFDNLEFKVDYCVGTTLLGKFTFSVDMAITQALQACDNHAVNIYSEKKAFVEYDEEMEKKNSDNYMDYQALKQIINKQEFKPSYYYIFSLFSGLINEYYVELSLSSNHFKSYKEALDCAFKNKEVKEFVEAGFKSVLENIAHQKQAGGSTFIFACDVILVSALIDIYVSSAKFKRNTFMFALTNFDFSIDSSTYDELRIMLLRYKDKGIKFALVVNEEMKMITHPFFTLFDAFIIPNHLYKNIRNDEKSRLSTIRMIEVLPQNANVILTGVTDKVEVEILMTGDIDYFSGPILGSATNLNEKPDIIAMRKLQSLIQYKESEGIYE